MHPGTCNSGQIPDRKYIIYKIKRQIKFQVFRAVFHVLQIENCYQLERVETTSIEYSSTKYLVQKNRYFDR